MKSTRTLVFASAALVVAGSARAGLVQFSYTQTDSTTGSGQISAFVAGGHNFNVTSMPLALVVNPNPGLTPTGFIGAQTAQAGATNEPNSVVGLLWSGFVTAQSTDGFLIDIQLLFVPKQTQVPDVSDYTWNVIFGDSAANGVDTISDSIRTAMWFSRDDVVDAVDTANTFQRYTQTNFTFTAGQNTFSNTNTITAAIKDAQDSGDPQGTDAVGRNLAFYWGWRDTGTISQGAFLVDDFTVGGLLNADDATIRPVPEPGSALMLLAGSALTLRRRRRIA